MPNLSILTLYKLQATLIIRGLHHSNFRVTKDGVAINGVGIDFYADGVAICQMTSLFVRLSLMGIPFTKEDILGTSGAVITIEIIKGAVRGTLFEYLPSESEIVKPLPKGMRVGRVIIKPVSSYTPFVTDTPCPKNSGWYHEVEFNMTDDKIIPNLFIEI